MMAGSATLLRVYVEMTNVQERALIDVFLIAQVCVCLLYSASLNRRSALFASPLFAITLSGQYHAR